MNKFLPEGYRIQTEENKRAVSTPARLAEAMERGTILEGRVTICDSSHNLWVDLPGMQAVIPREEGAVGIREGTTRDIALISRVNKPVCFVVTELTCDTAGVPLAILSRRIAQERCQAQYLDACRPGDILPACVTHLEPFGCFVDIGCGIPSLIPIDSISVSRISHPSDRFTVGQQLRVIFKGREGKKILLTHKELLGTWEENAAQFQPGETVAGIVRSVENYGIFVELTPNLAGLAELKPNVTVGQHASVYIKSILPERMKIKLILVDVFAPSVPEPAELHYFIQDSHMDRWQYASAASTKSMESLFTSSV